MNSFAEYILSEEDFGKKIEIMSYLKKKTNIFFDNFLYILPSFVGLFNLTASRPSLYILLNVSFINSVGRIK